MIEHHPLKPFLPDGARLLMLGSFPPARHRWCMDFFYPNFTNDMWRIFGLCLHDDKMYFVDEKKHTFRREAIEQMLREQGIALYDTAEEVIRTKNTASDKYLEVVRATDLHAFLHRLPSLQAIVTTGEKATALAAAQLGVSMPKVGSFVECTWQDHHSDVVRSLRLYRMPSSSRAYPMKLESKAEYYKEVIGVSAE
ncbi:MAG: uracil-DNA glycosylase family protein [Prevotella sp.]|nr:uracil-DNA glycosylase family protein [Prevotella sp.]